MIPKIIHYCWLSDDPIPEEYMAYINGWKQIMPDFTIKKWDRKAINLDEHPFAKQAFEAKKYAFAADYIRAYALYTEGGIYLDSDVKVIKPLNKFLDVSYFTSVECTISKTNYKLLINRYIDKEGNRIPGMNCFFIGLQAAIVGSEAGSNLIKDIYEFYQKQQYIQPDNTYFHQIAPSVHALYAEKYGFRYKDCYQELKENIKIYPSSIFATRNMNISDETCAIHYCGGSWTKKSSGIKGFLKKIKPIMNLYLKWKIISKNNNFNI